MKELTNNIAFTSNSDTSLTWKALEYIDGEGDFHEAILDENGNPCTINIFESIEGYELSNSLGELYLPHSSDSISMLSVLEFMAKSESEIKKLNNALSKLLSSHE